MPSKTKPKITLAQRLSGIQQIILAEVRAAQHRLNQAVDAGDYTAIQNMLAHFQRIMEMRQLSQKLLDLARAEKASPPAPPAPIPASEPTTIATPAPAKKEAKPSTLKTPAKKSSAKKPSTTAAKKSATPKQAAKQAARANASVTTNAATPSTPGAPAEPSTSEAAPAPIKRRGPTPTGLRTPERAFVLPILQTLAEQGGQADAAAVVEGVLERMRDQLKQGDFETTATSDQPRWKVSLYLARSAMVRQGLLRGDTPRGIWAISEQGERYLAEHTS
ncbi:hypothetical protein HRbin20_01416 [bacterium HR20]|jgi:outer membrane biosynthesis protein TonB|nr:hypothetical protein HRbin20_01416 [bacterium HR20]